jgi:E3 ubiquitin-protein ligase BIG BROTHER-like protein
MDAREDCCICKCDYEDGDELIILKCDKSHNFHDECLTQWLKINKVCPMCRAEVSWSKNYNIWCKLKIM